MNNIDPDLERRRDEVLSTAQTERKLGSQPNTGDTCGSRDVGPVLILCLRMAEDFYGIEVTNVREIAKDVVIYPVPETEEHILGVINLRGDICVVIDPLLRLGKGKTDVDKGLEVIVVRGMGEALGFAVEEVTDLIETSYHLVANPGIIKGETDPIDIKAANDKALGIIDPKRLFFDKDQMED